MTVGSASAADLASACLDEAARAAACAADVFIKESLSREVSQPGGELAQSIERGIALRVFLSDGRFGIAAATLSSEAARGAQDPLAASLARRAVAAAGISSPAPAIPLPGSARADGRGLGLFDPEIEDPIEDLLEAAHQMADHASRAAAPCAAIARLHTVSSMTHLFNSAGFAGSYRQTIARLDLTLTSTRDGTSAATRVSRAARSLRGLAADSAAAEAAALLEERIAPRLAPSGIHEVILSPRASADLVAAIAGWLASPPLSSDPRTSREGGPRRGERFGTNAVTLTDDGRLPGGVASAPFDGEGTRTRRTLLVERGILRDVLRDLEAGIAGGGSTGNGVRSSFREAPSLRPTNLFLHPGAASPEDLLSSIRQGIRISALGRVPPLPGPGAPFAVPFTGRWIHGGRLGSPLGGGYLAGNLKEILAEAEAAGSDLAFSHRRGSFGAPSLLIRRAPIRSS